MKCIRQDECKQCHGSGLVLCEDHGGTYTDACIHCKRVVTISNWTKTDIQQGCSVVSGTVVIDSSVEFKPGWHCHSTRIIDEKEDEFGNITFETKNSFYQVVGKGKSDPIANMLGKGILGVFY